MSTSQGTEWNQRKSKRLVYEDCHPSWIVRIVAESVKCGGQSSAKRAPAVISSWWRHRTRKVEYEYVELSKSQFNAGVETILITDDERGHYMWLKLGWENGKRVKYITVFARLRDGKFWIEEDWTEDGIATDLVREGVPKEDIVLAFHDPETRKHTDFAAA